LKSNAIHVRRFIVAGIAVAVAVASTGGSRDSAQNGGAPVSDKLIRGAGRLLVDSKGRALYVNDQERRGMVLCTGACLSFWRPLTISGQLKSGAFSGKLAVVRRPDGKRQVAYKGKPLYSFTLDKPGKVTGDGFADAFGGQKFTWHVARGTKVASSPRTTTSGTTAYPGY
jgi:predicted lipoprotein with Yx(FWY)xxD motif